MRLVLFAFLALCAGAAHAAEVGKPAPDFKVADSNGKTHELSAYKGKWVVLEWLNHGCPYVRKHYDGKNMQTTQKQWTDKGVTWLSIISSAPGKQGHSTPEQANADAKKYESAATAILLDADSKVGMAYGARTTPEIVVINPEGVVVYSGAMDDKPTTDQADLKGATNYANAALTEAMAGKPVSTPTTKPYGCSVKYP
jgi:peroxiredoxin